MNSLFSSCLFHLVLPPCGREGHLLPSKCVSMNIKVCINLRVNSNTQTPSERKVFAHRPAHTYRPAAHTARPRISNVHTRIVVVHTRIVVSVADKNGGNIKRVLLPRSCLFYSSEPKGSSGKVSFYVITPNTQDLPQRKELRVQPARWRQAIWAVYEARSTAR